MKSKILSKILKLFFVLLCVTTYSTFLGVGTANAGGIPQYDHTTSLPTLYLNDSGSYCNTNPWGCGYFSYQGYAARVLGVIDAYSFGNNYSFHGGFSGMLAGSGYYEAVEFSNDGVNWTQLARVNANTSGYSVNLNIAGTYRYMRAVGEWWSPNNGSYSNFNWAQFYSGSGDLYLSGADQATAQGALDAANAANQAAQATVSYAQNASTQSSNASSYASQALNWLNGSWGGYNLGTVGANATSAMNNSASANTNAANAWNSANTANSYLTNSTYGLSAINSSVGIANNALTNSTYGLSAINNNINNTTTAVNTLQSAIPYLQAPLLIKVYGYNNATATSTTSFKVSMTYSGANEYQYQVDNGGWSGWNSLSSYNSSGYFTATVPSSSGQHTIYVQLRNNNGSGIVSPVASGQMTMFKL